MFGEMKFKTVAGTPTTCYVVVKNCKTYMNGKLYMFISGLDQSYEEAVAACKEKGGSFFIPQTKDEIGAYKQAIERFPVEYGRTTKCIKFWYPLKFDTEANEYVWVDEKAYADHTDFLNMKVTDRKSLDCINFSWGQNNWVSFPMPCSAPVGTAMCKWEGAM